MAFHLAFCNHESFRPAAEDSWNLVLYKAFQHNVVPDKFSGTDLTPEGEFIPFQLTVSFWVPVSGALQPR